MSVHFFRKSVSEEIGVSSFFLRKSVSVHFFGGEEIGVSSFFGGELGRVAVGITPHGSHRSGRAP